MNAAMDARTAQALEIARQLARDGIPVFIAPPSDDPKDSSGFKLPRGWQQIAPDPAALDGWQPGWAVCAVMGCGLDLVDMDLYANAAAGTLMSELMPVHYGYAATVSGGVHAFIRSIGVASRNNFMPGVDIKAGTPDGKGRGFAFLAPTIRKSKVTGQPAHYGWIAPADAARARAAGDDRSGVPLAQAIERVRKGGAAVPAGQPSGRPDNHGVPGAGEFMKAGPWADIEGTLDGGRNEGVMRLASALRGQGGWSLEDAVAHMDEHVWPLINPAQGGHEFTREEYEATIRGIWDRYEDGAVQDVAQAAEQLTALGQGSAPAAPDQAAPPGPGAVPSGVGLTDAYLAERVARQCLWGRFLWAPGVGWHTWDTRRWAQADQADVHDAVRQYFIWLHASAANEGADHTVLAKMSTLLSKARIGAITDLTRGIYGIRADAARFDAYPDLLNTPDGVVNLRTGEIRPPDPSLLLTKITKGSYRPGFTHPDWEQALTALDAPERAWFQRRIGQGITGHQTPDGVMPVLQGGGENGKGLLSTDGVVPALGDYAYMASPKLIAATRADRSEHSTERADLRGKRLLIGEELTEGRAIDVTALKQIMDVGRITARYVHKDNITFDASHSLMVTTNYVPVVAETDHGTWRRLALLKFRHTFRKTAAEVLGETDRLGDPGLKRRIKSGTDGRHDAIVTWAVDGARAWYADERTALEPTATISADTRAWRANADRILGYWDSRLIAAPGWCILADEMLDAFNAWITGNGHNPWPRETFAPRFEQHHETTAHGVESRRTKALSRVSRWAGEAPWRPLKPVPRQATVWLGVRFRTADEQEESGEGAARAQSPKTPLVKGDSGTYVKPYAPSAPKISSDGEQPGGHTDSGTAQPAGSAPAPVTPGNQNGSATGAPAPSVTDAVAAGLDLSQEQLAGMNDDQLALITRLARKQRKDP